MGDINQSIFGKAHIKGNPARILEVGSKNYGSTTTFRDFFRGCYIGVDVSPGDGVDAVIDLTNDTGALAYNFFDLVICCSVLEHVPHPWKMAENITKLTAHRGQLFVSVPWTWRFHPYPSDYFRFSPEGIKAIFPGFEWGKAFLSTTKEGEIFEFTGRDDNRLNLMHEGRKYLPCYNFNMIGVKK